MAGRSLSSREPSLSSLEPWLRASLRVPAAASASFFLTRLRARQAELLAETLLQAANAPQYASLAVEAGLFARELRAAANASRRTEGEEAARTMRAVLDVLPCTFPAALAEAPERFLAVGQSEVEGVISLPTSGSSGPGKRIFCADTDLAATMEFFFHGMRGVFPCGQAQRAALLMSGERPGSVGHLFLEAMRRLGAGCRVFGLPHDSDAAMRALLDYEPTCLVGLPGHIFALARHADAAALARCVERALFSGSGVSLALVRAVEEGLGCEVFQHYGLTEGGLAGAVECAAHTGCHSKELDWFLEIVDADGRRIATPGLDGEDEGGAWSAHGEIVMTTLNRRAMPLIRYRTGDAGRLSALPCACGSSLLRLEVTGRIGDDVPFGISRAGVESLVLPLPWLAGLRLCLCRERGRLLVLALAAGEPPSGALEELRKALEPMPAAARAASACAVRAASEIGKVPGSVKQDLTPLVRAEFEALYREYRAVPL